MRVMIVDDEILALDRLQRLLSVHVQEIVRFDSSINALLEFKKGAFDIVFLDISMPQINGLDLAKKLIEIDENIFIIFQTAYEEHALEAFKSGGVDYLLKPIEDKELQKSLKKVEKFRSLAKTQDEKKLLGKNGDTYYLVDIEDVYYIKADLDEVIVRTKNGEFYMRKKMGELQEFLQSRDFFRIHRSYLINTSKIKSMKSIEQSKLQISFIGIEDKLTSSKEGAKDFREYLESKSI
ncbi:MAG TPA: DNA-binding response regulator [Sulfurospirillum sp. UBA12182]|nr:MAG TPA: DNA-binding response regulator [Sulfurospirillum sp. UBA12182]